MSSPTHTRPVATLYPSSQEDVNVYMAAIRLASTVRKSMDAPKAGVDTKEAAVDADSYGRHHHKFPPQTPANLTTPGKHETVPVLNETSSAHSASDTTKAGLVRPQDSQSSSRRSMSIVDTPTGATLEARKPHHGYFPPPEPPIGSTQAPPGKPRSRRTGPIPITNNHGPNGIKWYGPGDIPPQCQLYATNTETNNDTFAVCPVTRRTSNTTPTLTSHHQLHTGDTFNPHILAIRDIAMCEAPTTGFKQQLACGNLDGWFALAFFILFWIIGLAWVVRRKYNTRKSADEEIGSATWPRLLDVSTNNSPEAKAKPRASNVSTNSSSEARLRETLCRVACEEEQRLNERLGAKRYEPAAWRSASRRAARANGEGNVGHDAGPVAVLPDSFVGELYAYPFERLPPSL